MLPLRFVSVIDDESAVYDKEYENFINVLHQSIVKRLEAHTFTDEQKMLLRGTVRVLISNRLRTCAGRACGGHTIKLHHRLLKENPEGETIDTFIHELAHIICQRIHKKEERGHGELFKFYCKLMGGTGDRLHTMNVDKYRSEKPFAFICKCQDYVHRLSVHMERNHRKAKYTMYRCRVCKAHLKKQPVTD